MPFGNNCEYADFAECVRKNQGKTNPEGYCATLQKNTEEHCRMADTATIEHRIPTIRTRSYPIEELRVENEGRNLSGYLAVFNQVERITGFFEDWDEQFARGSFKRTLAERQPVMQFDHGRDARTGTVPIGKYTELMENQRGLKVRGTLFENPVVDPIRQAIADGALTGMSVRFEVIEETVEQRKGQPDLRTITDVDLHEGGPVVFPAYTGTSVSVRSILAGLDPDETRELLRELAAQAGLAADLTDFTGRSATRSGDGGDPGDPSSSGGTPADPTPEQVARERTMNLRRDPRITT